MSNDGQKNDDVNTTSVTNEESPEYNDIVCNGV